MARKRRAPKGKKMNPTFFVFCEGETEEAYVRLLKPGSIFLDRKILSQVVRMNNTIPVAL